MVSSIIASRIATYTSAGGVAGEQYQEVSITLRSNIMLSQHQIGSFFTGVLNNIKGTSQIDGIISRTRRSEESFQNKEYFHYGNTTTNNISKMTANVTLTRPSSAPIITSIFMPNIDAVTINPENHQLTWKLTETINTILINELGEMVAQNTNWDKCLIDLFVE